MKLQQEYYTKLKASGWIDIEDTTHPLRPLICWHSLKWRNVTRSTKEQIENYYQKARELLHTYPFTSDVQKKIWELHSDGLSKKKIEQQISGTDSPYKRESIGLIINRIQEMIK